MFQISETSLRVWKFVKYLTILDPIFNSAIPNESTLVSKISMFFIEDVGNARDYRTSCASISRSDDVSVDYVDAIVELEKTDASNELYAKL